MELCNPAAWRRRLGYMPVPLFGEGEGNSFVMLNGHRGNFCLDLDRGPFDSRSVANLAWSADVDHYLCIRDSQIAVVGWHQPDRTERYPVQQISENLALFQQYLESKQAPVARSVVTRAISLYRTIRAYDERADETLKLRSFLCVLAEGLKRYESTKHISEHWVDAAESVAAARDLFKGQSGIAELLDLLVGTDLTVTSSPDVRLVVRHAAGRVFQEAHYLATVPNQLHLFDRPQASPTRPAAQSLGAFFTPTPLVRTVVEQAIRSVDLATETMHVFDPACGSGEFLKESLRQLGLKGFKGKLRITGFDVSLPACLMARFSLAAEACQTRANVQIDIQNRDGLVGDDWPGSVDLCVMNPPFMEWRNLSTPQRSTLKELLGDHAGQRPDLAMAFLKKAVDSLADGGVLGSVLPASILDGTSALSLRRYVESKVSALLSARLGSQVVFSDVMVDPALFVARSKKDGQRADGVKTTLLWADHDPRSSEAALRALRMADAPLDDCIDVRDNFSIYKSGAGLTSGNWAPRPYKSAKLLNELSSLPKVGDFFSVQQGTITGMNRVFILDDVDFAQLPKAEQKYFRPAIMNKSLEEGRLLRQFWIFFPYDSRGLRLQNEDELVSAVPRYYANRLKPNCDALVKRARIDRSCWWKLSEHRSWQLTAAAKIVSSYFGGAGSFAYDADGFFVVVQGYGWIPRPKHAWFGTNTQYGHALVAILGSKITNVLLAGISNNLAGGQWNLSKRYVENMPIIDLRKLEKSALETLALFGTKMAEGEPYDKERLDWVVLRAVGVRDADV